MLSYFELLLKKLLSERQCTNSEIAAFKQDLHAYYKIILDKVAMTMIIDEFEDEKIIKAMMNLTRNERIVMAFYIIKELEMAEIALILGTTLSNVYSHKSNALKRLREELKDTGT